MHACLEPYQLTSIRVADQATPEVEIAEKARHHYGHLRAHRIDANVIWLVECCQSGLRIWREHGWNPDRCVYREGRVAIPSL